MIRSYLAVMLGGAFGSLLRFLMVNAVMNRYAGRFPVGTFLVNVLGSFAIGLVMTLFVERHLNENWRLFIVTGFLGGYTTFSAFEYEIFAASRDGEVGVALLYVISSVLCGLIAVFAGVMLARRWT